MFMHRKNRDAIAKLSTEQYRVTQQGGIELRSGSDSYQTTYSPLSSRTSEPRITRIESGKLSRGGSPHNVIVRSWD